MSYTNCIDCNQEACIACQCVTRDSLVAKCSEQSINDRLPTVDEVTTINTIAKQCQHLPKMSSNRSCCAVFLFIFLCVILVRNSGALPASIGVTASGQRLILHTPSYRQRYHQQLLQQHHTNIQTAIPHHRHHLHHRAVDAMEESSTLPLTKTEFDAYLSDIEAHYKNINSSMVVFFNESRNKTLEQMHNEWERFALDLKHPFSVGLHRKFFDDDYYNNLAKEDIPCLDARKIIKDLYVTLQLLTEVVDIVHRDYKDPTKINRQQNQPTAVLILIDELFNGFADIQPARNSLRRLMEKMGVEVVNTGEYTTKYTDSDEIEWLLGSEILSVMQLVRARLTAMRTYCVTES